MPKALPQSSDFLNNPDHSLLHRIVSVDTDAPESSIDVDSAGDVFVPGRVRPNAVLLDTTPTTITPTVGQIYWDTDNQTAAIDLDAGVTLQLGQEEYIRVVNKTGVQLNDGDVVRVSSAQGNRPTAVLAQANTFQSSVVIGVVTQNIAINQEGFVTTHGVVNGYDTSNFSGSGAYLYLDSVTPGKLTDNVATPVPAFIVPVAVALNKTNNGAIFVSPFYPRSTDGTLAGNSNSYSPSEKAIKTYADTKIPITVSTDTNHPNGFCVTNDGVNTADTTMSFDTSTKIFTLAKINSTFSFYCGGTKFTKSADQTVDLTSIWEVNKMFYIYENSSGVLSVMTTPWDITGNAAPVSTVVWNGTSSFAIVSDERHSAKNNNAWHEWAHDAIGSKISPFDFGITTLNSTSTVIQGGELLDEDIHNTIGTSTDSVRIVYRTGSVQTYADTLSTITASVVGGVLKYDSSGTLTSVSDGYYIRNIVLVSNVLSSSGQIVCRVAQSQHANISDARNSAPPVATSYLSNETREIYSVIWQNVGGTPELIEYTDFRASPTLPNGFVSKTPIYLDSIEDVMAPSPSVDNILKWNGLNWVNGTSATTSATAGIDFFLSTPTLINRTQPGGLAQAGTSGNGIFSSTLSKTPVTTWAANVTISQSTPAVITWNNHGLPGGTPVVFSTSGTLPTGIVAGTTYYVKAAGWTTNTFQISSTVGDAGSPIATSSPGSGTHTATTGATTIQGIAQTDTRPFARFLYDTALARTSLNSGVWDFTTFAYASGGSPTITHQLYQVVPASSGTCTVTGAGANSRTITITSGQFTGTYFAANATNTTASFIELPSGVYQITAKSDNNTATITVPTGYSNESAVAFKIWNKLFGATTAAITAASPNFAQLSVASVQPSFTIANTDKMGLMYFVTATSNNRTVTVGFNGTATSSHISTPLITLHGNLAGLQGGTGAVPNEEYYHLTAAQASVVGNTSGTNTGDNSVNSSSAPIGRNITINGTTYDLSADRTWTISTGISWSVITADQTASVDVGYIANKGTLLTLSLPTTCAVGKTVRIAGMNSGLWKVAQGANQYIKFGNQTTSTGVGGYLSSVLTYDAVELICIVADTGFMVVSSVGNITIV